MTPPYAELHALSNFSFLRGASHPEELVTRAHELGYRALALTDDCSLAGVVRAHQRAEALGLQLIIGSEFTLSEGSRLVLLAQNRRGYHQLCRLITLGRRRAAKGSYTLSQEDFGELDGCIALLLDGDRRPQDAAWLARLAPGRAYLAVELHRGPEDAGRLARLERLSADSGLPLVASGDVHMHVRARRRLQDTLTAIRHGCTLAAAGHRLFPNGERHLRSRRRLAQLYPPVLLARSVEIAAQCSFRLDELRYRYPAESVPAGETPMQHLRTLTEAGLTRRWPQGTPVKVRTLIERELALIEALDYPHYFLTVHDIVAWARARGILCQGRGSAANSAVCYALGITAVDPSAVKTTLLLERFISRERGEPPDIDVDFEHQRREEVIQHIYEKYGRERAALAATVITYRAKSAIRDVGKALGLALADIDRICASLAWWDDRDALRERLIELGFDPDAPLLERLFALVAELQGFPRHLSQHVGGFVISERPLHDLVPIENAAMAERTIIQWDKDDLDALGLLKIDCLALGMLTAIRKSFELIADAGGPGLDIDRIRAAEQTEPAAAAKVYAMLQAADSVGVFQVESRAQMAMLPRLKPREFYDLVIETAIVRPGPIQGGMVHPYLKRRQGREAVRYPPRLKPVLERTLGVPIFQEQVMQICVEAAGFSPGEADQVRRSMAAWRRSGSLEQFRERLLSGMHERGYDTAFAEQIYAQIQGFAEYGFPESHAASFAVLVWVSAWLKYFHPAAFLAGLLNSQPMGFYSPSQLIQDARRHGVDVRPVDATRSAWEATLEDGEQAVRLGLCSIRGLSEACGQRIVVARPVTDLAALNRNARLDRRERRLLAEAGALQCLAGDRHRAQWQVQGLTAASEGLALAEPAGPDWAPRPAAEGEALLADYRRLGFTLGRHPLALLRPRLTRLNAARSDRWRALPDGRRGRVAGLVTNRQRPGTARGIIFMTLEDEAGAVNLIVRNEVLAEFRREVLQAPLIIASGRMQSEDGVQHLLVERLEDHSPLLGRLEIRSRDFQ